MGYIKKGRLVIRENVSEQQFSTISAPNVLPKSTSAGKIDNNFLQIIDSSNRIITSFLRMNEIIPPGTVVAYAGTIVPNGWLLCDGAEISRTTFANLFAAIGTAHGSGDGVTTFRIPDYRGRFLRGRDGGVGRDPDRASRTAMNTGGATGDNVGSVQGHQFGSHNHGGGDHYHLLWGDGGDIYGSGTQRAVSGNQEWLEGWLWTENSGQIINSNGGNETRPINAYVNYIIKT